MIYLFGAAGFDTLWCCCHHAGSKQVSTGHLHFDGSNLLPALDNKKTTQGGLFIGRSIIQE